MIDICDMITYNQVTNDYRSFCLLCNYNKWIIGSPTNGDQVTNQTNNGKTKKSFSAKNAWFGEHYDGIDGYCWLHDGATRKYDIKSIH